MLRAATVGVAEHGNSAVLVTVAPGGELLDRRRIDLTDRGLPTHPHHHEGSWAVGRYLNIPGARALSLADAVALVERVRASAARGARESLEALAAAVPVPIASIAIRVCPKLPPTTEERIADNRAQTFADSVMYREALATAAEARGWSVHWYDRERVFRDAAAALGREDVDAFLHAMGRSIGPPWQAKHKLAAAAALAATGRPRRGRPPDNMQLQRTVTHLSSSCSSQLHTRISPCLRNRHPIQLSLFKAHRYCMSQMSRRQQRSIVMSWVLHGITVMTPTRWSGAITPQSTSFGMRGIQRASTCSNGSRMSTHTSRK